MVGEVIGQCGQLGPQVGSVLRHGCCQVSPPRWNGNPTAVSFRRVDADSSSAAATSGSRCPMSRSISPGTAVPNITVLPMPRTPVYRVARPGRRDRHPRASPKANMSESGRRAGVGDAERRPERLTATAHDL